MQTLFASLVRFVCDWKLQGSLHVCQRPRVTNDHTTTSTTTNIEDDDDDDDDDDDEPLARARAQRWAATPIGLHPHVLVSPHPPRHTVHTSPPSLSPDVASARVDANAKGRSMIIFKATDQLAVLFKYLSER